VSLRRRLVLAGGVAMAGLGLVLVRQPGLLGGLSVGQTAVLTVGVVALFYALLPLGLRRGSHRRQAPSKNPGAVPDGSVPGEQFDRLFAAAEGSTVHHVDRRNELRRRLEESALRAVRRRDDCSLPAAQEAIDEGTWTDDPIAASYLANPEGDVAERLPMGRRLRFHLSGSSPEIRAARRVADEIAAITATEAST
jgi:hypothetical protein